MSEQLIPPDFDRCQAETLPGSFMTLGPRTWRRCEAVPTWIGNDGVGEMSLCDACRAVCEQKMPGVTFRPILPSLV